MSVRKSQGAPGYRKGVVGLTRQFKRVPRWYQQDPLGRMGFWPTAPDAKKSGDFHRIARCQICGAAKFADARWFGDCCSDIARSRMERGMSMWQIVLSTEHEPTQADHSPIGFRCTLGALRPDIERFSGDYLDRLDDLITAESEDAA